MNNNTPCLSNMEENERQHDGQGLPAQLCADMELARSLLMYAVDGVLATCGNSYVNACTEQWLDHAASLGAYPKEGPFIGNIMDVREAWSDWLAENGGLPEWPDSPHYLARMGIGQNDSSAGNPARATNR